MNRIDLLSITFGPGIKADLQCSVWVVIGLVVVFVAMKCLIPTSSRSHSRRKWKAVEANIGLGNIGNVKICPDEDIACIAHQAWVEIMTRKAGLPFDERNDVIVEVYNSWYELFKELRHLLRSIPATEIRDSDDAKKLVEIIMKAMNDGLRPHLTRWQAKFRRWYDGEIKKGSELTPQAAQERYPEFAELTEDLKIVNKQMVQFADVLKQIAYGR